MPPSSTPSVERSAQPITVHVPVMLRDTSGGQSRLSLTAVSVRDALEQLEARYPALYRSICDDTGAVRRHVGVFVNDFHIRDLEGVDTLFARSDALTILPAVSGG